MQFTVYTCILLISWIGAKMIVASSLTTGELMSLISYATQILMSLMMLSMIFVMLTMSHASAKRIVEVLEEKSDLTNPENPIYTVENGSVEFCNVNFKYSYRAEKASLSDVNINIKSGMTVGVIGGTGSGKQPLRSQRYRRTRESCRNGQS